MSNENEVLVKTTSVLTITDGQQGTQSNCLTNLSQVISAQFENTTINGCTCCSVNADTLLTSINSNELTYIPNSEPINSCAICQGVIESGTGIILDGSVYVGGLVCSGVNSGCLNNFRYSETDEYMTDNGVIYSYVCGIRPVSNIQYVRANFQVPVDGNYSVTASVYLNNILVGTGTFSGYVTTTEFKSVGVELNGPINIVAGSIFKVVYSP
jgi:hypothetical protein